MNCSTAGFLFITNDYVVGKCIKRAITIKQGYLILGNEQKNKRFGWEEVVTTHFSLLSLYLYVFCMMDYFSGQKLIMMTLAVYVVVYMEYVFLQRK